MAHLRLLRLITIGLVCIQIDNLSAETILVDVQVKTAHENNAKTGNKVYFSLLHRKNRNSRLQVATAELRNSKKRNFTAGAISSFQVELDCPVKKICGFRLSVGNSDDAWACEGVKFQITHGGKRSQVYSQPIPKSQRWFSAAANDGGKKSRALQFRDYGMPKAKYSVHNAKMASVK